MEIIWRFSLWEKVVIFIIISIIIIIIVILISPSLTEANLFDDQ